MRSIYRTGTPLPSKNPISYIFSTNIRTEFFKHAAHSQFFPLQNAAYFIMLPFLVPVLFAFYIQGVLKFKAKFRCQKFPFYRIPTPWAGAVGIFPARESSYSRTGNPTRDPTAVTTKPLGQSYLGSNGVHCIETPRPHFRLCSDASEVACVFSAVFIHEALK
jgi:hypothetical protein